MQIRPQQFTALAAATLLAVLLASATYSWSNRWSAGRVEGTALLPALARDASAAQAIEITQGDKRLTLERAGNDWRLKERAGFPASAERVRALIVTLQRAELIEPKTAAKDKLALLELEDPAGKDAKSRLVRIRDDKGRVIAEVVLGKSRFDAFGSGKGGIYVRRPNETQTWLATGEPKAPLEVKDWVRAGVFEHESAKFTKITIEHAGEAPLVIEKGDGKEPKLKLAAIPEGQKMKQGANLEQIATGLASIDLEDMRKLESVPSGDGVTVVKLEAEGGLTVVFRTRKDGEASWLSLAAQGTDAAAKKTADEINARTTGWEFKVPGWKAEQIGKRRADLLEAGS